MIEIVDYRAEWPDEFATIGGALRGALGDQALRIDHIGSTSVPGLAAKDRIDIQMTVESFEPALLDAIVSLGYQLRPFTADHRPPGASGPDSDWEKRFFAPPPGQRPTNLHVRAAGRANQRYALLFRDYLRAHPGAAAGYGELKRRLAVVCDTIDQYADTKDPVCDIIMSAAEEWAAATGWQPGPSDA